MNNRTIKKRRYIERAELLFPYATGVRVFIDEKYQEPYNRNGHYGRNERIVSFNYNKETEILEYLIEVIEWEEI